MASSGIRRKVDDLGRVVIPAGIRRTLGIREGDPVEVTVEGERVVLAKPQDSCVFCGREEESLTDFRGRLVCRDCLASLGSVADRRRATDEAAVGASAPPPRTPANLPDWDAPASRAAGTSAPVAPARPVPTTPPAPPQHPAATREPDSAPASAAVGPRTPRAPQDPEARPPTPAAPPAPADRRDSPAPQGRDSASAARETQRSRSSTAPATEPEDEPDDPPRRPPYDPASTTAW